MKKIWMTALVVVATTAAAHDETPQMESATSWIDQQRGHTKEFLSSTARHIDGWFGEGDPNKPARASLRVIVDGSWNRFDGAGIKPRVRGRLKLPSLENQLSVLVGDDELDDEPQDTSGLTREGKDKNDPFFDKAQTRKDNTSLAIRWSKIKEKTDIDADLGVRSKDLFLRLKAQKNWQLPNDIKAEFEQVYRYGTHSKHTLSSTLYLSQPRSEHRSLVNRTNLHYTHKDRENLDWHNSLYQQHHYPVTHGQRVFSYGVYTGGPIEDKKPKLNTWGPYVSYRQPVWRDWFFVQADATYYKDKSAGRDHYLSLFSRLEMVF